jgi:hypothetical protein
MNHGTAACDGSLDNSLISNAADHVGYRCVIGEPRWVPLEGDHFPSLRNRGCDHRIAEESAPAGHQQAATTVGHERPSRKVAAS